MLAPSIYSYASWHETISDRTPQLDRYLDNEDCHKTRLSIGVRTHADSMQKAHQRFSPSRRMRTLSAVF